MNFSTRFERAEQSSETRLKRYQRSERRTIMKEPYLPYGKANFPTMSVEADSTTLRCAKLR
jgi:hypothetical protein